MIRKNNGYSLTVLVIAITVIIIITTTAVISIKNFGKDKDISNFMNDLELVKEHVIEYYAQNNTLPVTFDANGKMISAEEELITLFTEKQVLSQFHEEDIGDYYYVDLKKLGKIHLSDEDRGYIINEESLNVYVTKPVTYNGVDYYTLTPFLLGKETITDNGDVNFEINVMGNPITWAKQAELLISVPNVKVGEAEGWNFKWGKASDITNGDETGMKYFTYGDTITINENGIYTIIVENSDGKSLKRNVVVSKIDNIPPVVMYVSGELYVDDAETGVKSIRCKVKESKRFDIDEVTRKDYPKFFTMNDEEYDDTQEELVESYLWGDQNIKGETVDEYLNTYKEYYEKYAKYNSIVINPTTTSGEKENANIAIESLNNQYPQYAYNNQRYPDSERNLVIYVEDMAGNGTVYSALSRLELSNCQYVSGDLMTLAGSKVTINNGDIYTNKKDVVLFLQSLYAKSFFVTEQQVQNAVWEDFTEEYKDFTLSEGDGEKIVYAFFRDQSGKVASAYDKIFLDETPPSDDAPTVSYDKSTGLSIVVNQKDSEVSADNKETQSGLTGIYQYGIKKNTDEEYIWYSRISAFPRMSAGTYSIVTKATDKAGNETISQEATVDIDREYLDMTALEVGDYVKYTPDDTSTSTNWRVWEKDTANNKVIITPTSPLGSLTLSGATGEKGWVNAETAIEKECDKYISSMLGITENDVKSMKIEDVEKVMLSSDVTSAKSSNYGTKTQSYTSGTFYAEKAINRRNNI